MWPVGQTNAQAPQPMQASVLMLNGVSTFMSRPRWVSVMALAPMRSHMRVHRPQRMQVSSPVWKRGFSTPWLFASAWTAADSGQRARSISAISLRPSRTISVSVLTSIPSQIG